MRMQWIIIALFTAVLTGNRTAAAAVNTPLAPPRETSIDLARMLAGRGTRADQGPLERLLNRRRKFAAMLVSGVRSPSPAGRAVAMYLLGVYRISDGVPVLVANIAFRFAAPKPSRALLGPSSFHPALDALVSIGMPSVRAILKVLPQAANPLRQKLMVQVLVGVEGRAVARFRLRRLVAKAATAHEKVNLKAALADVAQVKGR